MYGAETSLYASHRSSFVPSRISRTSRNPRVVTSAAAGKLRVISAFVATVVPCEKSDTRPRSISPRSTPFMTAIIGSLGVDGTLVTRICFVSSSKMQTSVNVPPTSTATRTVLIGSS